MNIIQFLLNYTPKQAERVSGACLKFKAEQVDGDVVLPGKVLGHSSEEGLGKVESRNPEDGGCIIVYPFL